MPVGACIDEFPMETETTLVSDLRVVKALLWNEIASQLQPAELDEVKRSLGWSIIADNESLFEEAEALSEILGQVQVSTAAVLDRQRLCSNPNRNMVESEIRILIDRLREVAGSAPFNGSAVKDRDPDDVIPKNNQKEQAMLNYVSTLAAASGSLSDSFARPRTPSTRPSSARPGTASTRPSSTASSGSGAVHDPRSVVQSVQRQLNLRDIDAVKAQLVLTLQEEHTALMEDIDYLQGLLEEETDLQARASQPAPSVQDLKEYGVKLRAVVATEEGRVTHELRVSRMFTAAEEEQGRARRLRGMVQASRDDGGPQTLDLTLANGPELAAARESVECEPTSVRTSIASADGVARSSPRRGEGSAGTQGGSAVSCSSTPLVRSSSSSMPGPLGRADRAARAAPEAQPPALTSSSQHAANRSSSLQRPVLLGTPPSQQGGHGGDRSRLDGPNNGELHPSTAIGSHRDLSKPFSRLPASPDSRMRPALLSPISPMASPSPAAKFMPSGGLLGDLPAGQRSRSSLLGPAASLSIPGGVSSGAARKPPVPASAASGTSPCVPARTLSGSRGAGRSGSAGGPINLVEALDAEVDAVKGGVAAILAKHNYRPSSASCSSSRPGTGGSSGGL